MPTTRGPPPPRNRRTPSRSALSPERPASSGSRESQLGGAGERRRPLAGRPRHARMGVGSAARAPPRLSDRKTAAAGNPRWSWIFAARRGRDVRPGPALVLGHGAAVSRSTAPTVERARLSTRRCWRAPGTTPTPTRPPLNGQRRSRPGMEAPTRARACAPTCDHARTDRRGSVHDRIDRLRSTLSSTKSERHRDYPRQCN